MQIDLRSQFPIPLSGHFSRHGPSQLRLAILGLSFSFPERIFLLLRHLPVSVSNSLSGYSSPDGDMAHCLSF